MRNFYKIIFLFAFIFWSNNVYSNDIYVLDFTKVLNESKAGKEAQEFLKKKLNNEIKKFSDLETKIREEEKTLISQKKIISQDEYQKKVDDLRKKVSDLQKNRTNSLNSVAETRAKARKELLDSLNPILTEFMGSNNIELIFDKNVVLASKNELDITDKIIEALNKKLSSLNLK